MGIVHSFPLLPPPFHASVSRRLAWAGEGGVAASAKHLRLGVKQAVAEALVLSSRARSLVHPGPSGNEKQKLQVRLCARAERGVSGAACNAEASETLRCSSKWLPDVLALLNSPGPDTRNAAAHTALVLSLFSPWSCRQSGSRLSMALVGCGT